MMGNYLWTGLPMMIAGYVFSAPFFTDGAPPRKHGQKASLTRYVGLALIDNIEMLCTAHVQTGRGR